MGLTIAVVEAMSDGRLATTFLIEKTIIVSNRAADLETLLCDLADMLKKCGFTKKMVYDHYIS